MKSYITHSSDLKEVYPLYIQYYKHQLHLGFLGFPYCLDYPDYLDCIDKRATYDFNITVANNLKAVCNGNLIETIVNTDNTKTYHWKLTNSIPTYLS